MREYKIGELAEVLNINIDTIRYYEKIGLIPSPVRDNNQYRNYSEKYIQIIKFIILCKNNGFKLKEIMEIKGLINGDKEDIIMLKNIIREKIKEIEKKESELKILKNGLNEVIESCNISSCTITEFLQGKE